MVSNAATSQAYILLGVTGTDEDRAMHIVDEHASYKVTPAQPTAPAATSQAYIVSADTADGPTSWPLEDLKKHV